MCYVITALHWLLRTMKQNDAQYNKRNHRCCKPCLYPVPILWQYSIPDDGHRSCSDLSCISSTQVVAVHYARDIHTRFCAFYTSGQSNNLVFIPRRFGLIERLGSFVCHVNGLQVCYVKNIQTCGGRCSRQHGDGFRLLQPSYWNFHCRSQSLF